MGLFEGSIRDLNTLNTGAKRLPLAKPFNPDSLVYGDRFYTESRRHLYEYVGKTDKGNHIYLDEARRVFESKTLKPVFVVKK